MPHKGLHASSKIQNLKKCYFIIINNNNNNNNNDNDNNNTSTEATEDTFQQTERLPGAWISPVLA